MKVVVSLFFVFGYLFILTQSVSISREQEQRSSSISKRSIRIRWFGRPLNLKICRRFYFKNINTGGYNRECPPRKFRLSLCKLCRFYENQILSGRKII